MVEITVHGAQEANAALATLSRGLEQRAAFHAELAGDAERLTRDYLIKISRERHRTANRLGANPTGHLARAAGAVESSSSDEQATVRIDHPGIIRAFEDVLIRPGPGKKYLTIPLIAEAYGTTASEQKLLGNMLVFIRTRGGGKGGVLMKPGGEAGGMGTAWYLLVEKVRQSQDRTLLPSDEAYAQVARVAGARYIDRLLQA